MRIFPLLLILLGACAHPFDYAKAERSMQDLALRADNVCKANADRCAVTRPCQGAAERAIELVFLAHQAILLRLPHAEKTLETVTLGIDRATQVCAERSIFR